MKVNLGGSPHKLSKAQRAELGSEAANRDRLRLLAAKFGVSPETIKRAIMETPGTQNC
jgi:hypothetical protein